MRAPEFWQRGTTSPWPALLSPLSLLWLAGAWIDRRLASPKRAPVPVVSIGNLVAGGAGKTPTAIAVARAIQVRGRQAHVISRGYGGSTRGPHRVDRLRDTAADVGDEPLLLAEVAPTWIARNRALGALAAVQAGAEALVLDDAHQNHDLIKNLSLVVIDQDYGVGNGRLIPAGPLREPVADGLARADAIVLVGEPAAAAPDVVRSGAGKPVLRARLVPGPETEKLAGQKVVAFAGIGRPEKLFATLRDIGCRLVETCAFPDHHPYRPDELMRLAEIAARANARLVTTAKDFVRLPTEARGMVEVLSVSLVFEHPPELDRLLKRVLL